MAFDIELYYYASCLKHLVSAAWRRSTSSAEHNPSSSLALVQPSVGSARSNQYGFPSIARAQVLTGEIA